MISGKGYFVNNSAHKSIGRKTMKISQIPEGAEMHVAGIVFDPKFSQVLIVNNKAYKGKLAGAGFPGGRTSTSALL